MAIETVSVDREQQLRELWETADNAVAKALGICMLLSESASINAPFANAANAAVDQLADAEAALKQQWQFLSGHGEQAEANHV